MLYLFDLDGTLVDSLEDLKNATEYALKILGYPGHETKAYCYFVGNGVKKLIQRAFGSEDEKLYLQARELFDVYYDKHCLDHTEPYENLIELLKELKRQGHKVGVITNKPDRLAKKICHYWFKDSIDFCQGQVDGIDPKPNPYFVLAALKNFNVSKTEAFYIGDSNVDIKTGKNADIKTIGVTWGNRTYEELVEAGADYIVNDVQALRQVLLGGNL